MQYLRLRPGLVTQYIAEMGVAHRVAPYTTESHRGILPKSQGHRGFFGVTAKFWRSQIVPPVAAVNIAHIGVPPMYPSQSKIPGVCECVSVCMYVCVLCLCVCA